MSNKQSTVIMVPRKAVRHDLKTETNTIVYMPLASKTNHGVVKIGDGLNIDNDGLLTLNKDEITILQIAKNGEIIQPDENKVVNILMHKTDVGLGDVDNTSDKYKPVSIYQQQALDGKVDKFAGTQNINKAVTVDSKGYITYSPHRTFTTYNNDVVISSDTESYNFTELFSVSGDNTKNLIIDGSTQLKESFRSVSYNASSGVLTFERLNGSELNIDLPLELLIKSGYYDETTNELVLVLANGEELRIPITDLVNEYYADDTTLSLKNINGKLTFGVKNGGIKTNHIADYTIVDDKIVSVSGDKITGVVNESIKASQDANGNNIANTYRRIVDSYSRVEIEDLLKNKADVSQLPVVIRIGES